MRTSILKRKLPRCGRAPLLPLLFAAALGMAGCNMAGIEEASIASNTTPERVVTQIINNSCADETANDSESLTTGKVKGLSKVKDGFGIPYDEYAPEYKASPEPITDDSYEANKNRGIGYAGIEDHYVANLMAGQEHSPDHPEFEDCTAGSPTIFPELTTEEEKYGCNMRWEYSASGSSGGIPGYFDFLRGSGPGHRQYVAIHSLVSDKWCICCPWDWGPARAQDGYPPSGSGHYGNVGGVSPQVAEELGFDGHGERSDITLTEWWWVDNSEQVKCGPVSDLSSLTKGSGGSTASGTTSSGSSTSGTSTAVASGVTTANTAKVMTLAAAASGTSTISDGKSVKIEPANPNSFVNKIHPDLNHGNMPKERVKYIMMHDTESGTDDASAIIQAWINQGKGTSTHFMVDKSGKIFQCVEMDQTGWHSGSAGQGANEKFGLDYCDLNPTGQGSDGDNNMSWFSYGIEIVHEHEDGAYPQAQLNALDRLVAYIDDYLGFEPKIIDHKEWANQDGRGRKQDCSDDFPLENYKKSRNHNGVKTADDAKDAKASGACSDDSEDDSTSAGKGAMAIAKKAVELAGTATPDSYIPGGEHEKPSDPRLANYVKEKERVYPGDDWWASCCRVSATAIKASGADEEWPLGAPADMYDYAEGATDKWEQVGTWRAGDSSDCLKPGDVLITRGNHIKIFVGNEAVKEKFPSSDANMYAGSAGQYQPWCYNESTSGDGREYGIFRLKGDGDSTESSSTSDKRKKIIEFAKTQLGVPYNYGPGGGTGGAWENDIPNQQLACNGLTRWSYDAVGIEIPQGSIDQMTQLPTITSTGSVSTLKPGDIVCWDDVGRRSDIEYPLAAYRHVAIYAGNGEIIEAVPGVVVQRQLQDNEFSYGGSFGNLDDGGSSSGSSKTESSGKKKSSSKKSSKKTKKSTSKSTSEDSGGATGAAKELVEKAHSIIGSGYSWSGYTWTGDTATSVFTCSGVPDYCLGLPACSNSPETYWAKIEEAGNFTKDISKLKSGDLVFYPYGGRSPCGHVGIYIGNNQIIDSIPNGGVQIRDVNYMECLGGGPIVEGGGTGSSTKNKASRYVFVGDSRTCGLYETMHADLNPDDNSILNGTAAKAADGTEEFWIGKVGMGYPWYKDTAIPILDSNVKSGDAILIWLGVNGAPAYQKEYADMTNQKAKEWKAKGASVYFVSVGPVDEGKAANYGYSDKNSDIEAFNNGVKSGLSDAEWLDIYDKINQGFGSYDGIHYDDDTSKKIYQWMTEGCGSSGEAEDEDDEEDEDDGDKPIYVNVQKAG